MNANLVQMNQVTPPSTVLKKIKIEMVSFTNQC